MNGPDLINAQFGRYGYELINDASGTHTGPFDAVVPITGSGVTYSVLEVAGVSTANIAREKAVTGQTGPLVGRITSVAVSAGAARAYKSKDHPQAGSSD